LLPAGCRLHAVRRASTRPSILSEASPAHHNPTVFAPCCFCLLCVALQRSPDSTKVAVKREREQQADASRPPKRRATSGAAAAGPAAAAGDRNLGLDPETLVGMLNTPMARQLGAEGAHGC
jgi:hypothetical protein